MIQGVHTLGDKLSLFKEELKKLPSVENLSASNYLPVSGTKRDGNTFWLEGRSKIDNGVGGQAWRVDEDYIATMKMNLLAGRDFYKEGNADSASVIINQKMANALGLKDPIGKKIMNWRNYTVIGLVEDFHFESIKGEIGPLVFFKGDFGSILTTRIQGKDMAQSIAGIKSVWDQLMPNQPIRYTFVDETYAKMYSHVERTGNVFASCAILAILISCMGLFGLSTFMAEQRSKEISIRKILGASTGRLFQLLTANYLKLLLIAMLLGIPFSWYLMNNWLQDFAYQIDMDWWFFVFSAVLVAGIALMTVSKQALKLAFSNPAEVLKNE
jgi:putative ABC transport system permease protein